jgi:23S rRNA G2069 N7-methylase RlmK/C1962 C5-methylase RlmI
VNRQTDREKQLQQRYAELVDELKELSQPNGVAYTNGNSQE